MRCVLMILQIRAVPSSGGGAACGSEAVGSLADGGIAYLFNNDILSAFEATGWGIELMDERNGKDSLVGKELRERWVALGSACVFRSAFS